MSSQRISEAAAAPEAHATPSPRLRPQLAKAAAVAPVVGPTEQKQPLAPSTPPTSPTGTAQNEAQGHQRANPGTVFFCESSCASRASPLVLRRSCAPLCTSETPEGTGGAAMMGHAIKKAAEGSIGSSPAIPFHNRSSIHKVS